MTVRVNYLLRAELFRHVRKSAALLENIGRRIMQKHDEFTIAVRLCQSKRFPQPHKLSFHKLLCVCFFFFIPARNSSPVIKIERTLESISFCSDNRVIPVAFVAVLQKCKRGLIQLVQLSGLIHFPEMVMISSRQNLSSRQIADIL